MKERKKERKRHRQFSRQPHKMRVFFFFFLVTVIAILHIGEMGSAQLTFALPDLSVDRTSVGGRAARIYGSVCFADEFPRATVVAGWFISLLTRASSLLTNSP